MYRDSWDVMRRGDTDKALWQMRENFAKAWNPDYTIPSLSSVMGLGIAYLWLKDYQAAFEHFDSVNQHYPNHADCTYDMAGVAKWCLGERDAAVAEWQQGLEVDYADVGYGIKPPLLLFFASVHQPDLFSKHNAEKVLAQRLEDPRTESWPGPLAEFVLGRIDLDTVRKKGIYEGREDITTANHWEINFWHGVLELDRGNTVHYRQFMREVGQLSWDDYDRCSRLFLSKLWSPEFFLARHQAAR